VFVPPQYPVGVDALRLDETERGRCMRPRVMIALVALLVVVSVGSLQATAGGGERFTGTLAASRRPPRSRSGDGNDPRRALR